MSTGELDEAVRLALQALRSRPSALITDIDGTISPIVVNPSDAHVNSQVQEALRSLRARLDIVAVASGRAATDARSMVRVAGLAYIGNHGMETLRGGKIWRDPRVTPYVPVVEACLGSLMAILDEEPVSFESKGCTGSVHYRLAPDPIAAHAAIRQAIDRCEDCKTLRVADGRMVVNIFPPVDVTKGTAIQALAHDKGLRGIVYLGDDVTDLDAFSALSTLRAEGAQTLAIAVRSQEAPRALLETADASLDGVSEVTQLLMKLAASDL